MPTSSRVSLPSRYLNWPINWEAVKMIAELEGCRLESYQDVAGVWTIGWGHTGPDVTSSSVWTQEEADIRFCEELKAFASQIRPFFTVNTSAAQFSACVSLAYNIGVEAFTKQSSVLKLHNQGKFDAAANAFLLWNKARKNGKLVAIVGLTNRRRREAEMYRKGITDIEVVSGYSDGPGSQPDAAVNCERAIMYSSTWQGGAIAAVSGGIGTVSYVARETKDLAETVSQFPAWMMLALGLASLVAGVVVCWRMYVRKKEGK